jgi:AAA+ ATPase superfamily predicted ATPase
VSILIGREEEKARLKSLLNSTSSEFVAVYGRRRVGKTFLIRETLSSHFSFQLTGMYNVSLQQQLFNFHTELLKYGAKTGSPVADSWFIAFQQLIALLQKSRAKKKVVFLDELPWLDGRKSNFIPALEHFWNSWASARKDIILIVCGSAASWITNKLINNKGGLHNRVTQKIKLNPFTLRECELFLQSKKIKWNQYQVMEIYMAIGGIPYYLNALQPGLSAAQNIDRLCFHTTGLLKNEFQNLYASLFKKYTNHLLVTGILSKKLKGLTREEIIQLSKLPNGGGITKVLNELEESGFIRKYQPFNKKLKNSLYQLTDFYTLFYYHFIKGKTAIPANYWMSIYDSPKHRAWSGYAFEQVCQAHSEEIKKELGISGIQTSEATWKSSTSVNGAQIDLLIDRRDQVINICEMKFSINEFTIDKKYAANLRNKIGAFKTETKTRKSVFLTFITTYGVRSNEHADGLIQNNITMNALFK